MERMVDGILFNTILIYQSKKKKKKKEWLMVINPTL